MDLFKLAINGNQAGLGFNNYNGMSGNDRLRDQLYHCTYSDQTKFVIQKAVKQVLHVYPSFQTQILQFTQNNQQKRFLEIKGVMEIEVRGKNCKVDYNMMLPSHFPKKPPYVRIINRNPEYIVQDMYKSLRSPNDPKSYILNQRLTNIKNWRQGDSIVSIIIQSNNMMRQKFPFYKPSKGTNSGMNINSGWASINQQQQQSGPWGSNNYNVNQGFNNQGFNNQGFNNQGFNNQGFNSQGFNNMGGFNTGYQNNQPPIPFSNNNQNSGQIIANGQKFVGQSKKIFDKLKTENAKAIQKIQQLQTIKCSLDSQQNYLRQQNMRMSEFLKKNQNSDLKDLASLIRPKDDRSEQILDLTSSLKAREDCISFVQERFNGNELSFEQFIKIVKKLEQDKFDDKVLLAKCIQS